MTPTLGAPPPDYTVSGGCRGTLRELGGTARSRPQLPSGNCKAGQLPLLPATSTPRRALKSSNAEIARNRRARARRWCQTLPGLSYTRCLLSPTSVHQISLSRRRIGHPPPNRPSGANTPTGVHTERAQWRFAGHLSPRSSACGIEIYELCLQVIASESFI